MRRSHLYQSVMYFLIQFRRPLGKFALHVFREFLHLALHLLQSPPHIKNDFDSGQIDAQIPRQIQYQLEPLQIFLSI